MATPAAAGSIVADVRLGDYRTHALPHWYSTMSERSYRLAAAYSEKCIDARTDPSPRAIRDGFGSGEDLRKHVSYEALLSIFLQMYQRQHKGAMRDMMRKSAELLRLYNAGEEIADIALSQSRPGRSVSPYGLARIIAASILPGCTKKSNRKRLAAYMRDPSTIPDAHDRLRENVYHCIEIDRHNSPFLDRVRHNAGQEYEHILQRTLAARNIPFESEDDLKDIGMAKTPDVRLLVPIAINARSASTSGDGSDALIIINWIDSKAMFGDADAHAANLGQLHGYVNRLGPGMVIYWHGCVEGLHGSDPDIAVVSSMPTSFATLA